MDGWIDRWTDRLVDVRKNEYVYECMYGGIDDDNI